MLLAGIGQIDSQQRKNWFIVDDKETTVEEIEKAFSEFTLRNDISILLISQHVTLSLSLSI